jgi:threonyl-tRNA synthetase
MSHKLDEALSHKSAEEQHLWALRHTTEHILHQAVKELYPGILLAMGPATEDGFYFDFDNSPENGEKIIISDANFPKIEKRMREIIKKNLPLNRQEISVEEARKLFSDNPYKMEWVDEIEKRGEKVTIYWTGEPDVKGSMVDLCGGPHVASTGEVKAFKLLSVAGAYWHGDEKNKMLTRIYGTAFDSQEELDKHLAALEKAKQNDHRKLGAELGLFTFSDLIGKGLPLWTPKGATVRRELERFVVDEELKRGYLHVNTPDIALLDLYRTSGHYPYYKETMYAPIQIDEEEFMLRPMTCPHHFEIYKSQPRSYKELPMRLAELAQLYRYEKSGELTGLMRVRTFCLADAHIIARKSQAIQEINEVIDLIEYVAKLWGLKPGEDYRFRLSLGDRADDKKYYKDDAAWDFAENVLRKVLQDRGSIYYEAENEAAFYGPKIDVQMNNVHGKEESAFTVQYDFVMPKRFNLSFINEEGKEEEPIVVHRSSIGAIERTMAFLIEKFGGAFPLWLAPIQAVVIPISQDQHAYAAEVAAELKAANIRVENWNEAESMQKRIRRAEKEKVPYMLIIGNTEVTEKTVSIRQRGNKDAGSTTVKDLVQKMRQEISDKVLAA